MTEKDKQILAKIYGLHRILEDIPMRTLERKIVDEYICDLVASLETKCFYDVGNREFVNREDPEIMDAFYGIGDKNG
jgi:hypothetical protein